MATSTIGRNKPPKVDVYPIRIDYTQPGAGYWAGETLTVPVTDGDRVIVTMLATGSGQFARTLVGNNTGVYIQDGPNISMCTGEVINVIVRNGDTTISFSSYANSEITVKLAVLTVIHAE